MKAIFLALFLTLLALTTHAQDKIYLKTGTIMLVRVTGLNKTRIYYKPFSDTTGPEEMIRIADVGEIVYQNHTVDFFNTFGDLTDHPKPPKPLDTTHKRRKIFAEPSATVDEPRPRKPDTTHEGRNIFAITPMSFTSALNGTINDPGAGIGYERLFGHDGHFGLNMPLMIAFSPPKDFTNQSYLSYSGTQQYTAVYFMPGVKIYPEPEDEDVRFSAGASFFCIFGGEPEVRYLNNSNPIYNPSTGTYTYPNETGTYHYAMYGLMVSNSVNITVVNHLYISADISTGFPLSDNRKIPGTTSGAALVPDDQFVQIGFKFGYRY